ncbi:MAG: hypothetical protein EHM35_00585 [Planctomycetaceae bacterium]|nr:MAG: hypothetical protein EHM35_00585 [Planctomycetaceae bacterium]
MKDSIVRRGNHFIRTTAMPGWVLIDGPWFEYLNRFGLDRVRLPYPNEAGPAWNLTAWTPPWGYGETEWERIGWLPSHPLGPHTRRWWEARAWRAPKLRVQTGWTVRPNGALPALLCRQSLPRDADYLDSMLRGEP